MSNSECLIDKPSPFSVFLISVTDTTIYVFLKMVKAKDINLRLLFSYRCLVLQFPLKYYLAESLKFHI